MKLKLTTIMNFLCVYMVISLFLENIKLFDILGAPFKPTHILFMTAIVIVFIKNRRIVKRRRLAAGIFYMFLPLWPLYRIADVTEWLKSYVVWIIITVYFVIAFPEFYDAFQNDRKKYIKMFIYLMMVVQTLAVIQFILMNFAGVMFLKDPFGVFQFAPSFTSIRSGLYRAYSVYHEPSFLGLMNGIGHACVLYTQKECLLSGRAKKTFYVLSTLAMLVSLSAIAMYMYFITVLLYLLMTYWKKTSFYGIIALGIIVVYLWNFTEILAPAKRIFIEYDTVNTSGYERMNAPMQYAMRTLQYYPLLGRGIGQAGDIDNVGKIQTAMSPRANNSIFEVVVNFGFTSIFLFAMLIRQLIQRIKADRGYLLIALSLVGVLLSTGAYLSLDFLVILNFCLLLFREGREKMTEEKGPEILKG